MRQSSDSIAALAGALAKAQPELLNPEKSLTATIATDRLRIPLDLAQHSEMISPTIPI